MTPSAALQRLVEVARRQHKSLSTERTYALWLSQFMAFLPRLNPALPSEQKVEAFLSAEAKRGVAASTQNQAFNALRFFYNDCLGQPLQNVDALRATRPQRIRYAPTRQEIDRLIPLVRDVGGYPINLIVRLLYGCGLRVNEALSIRVKDLDLTNSKLSIMGGKGQKDRVVCLPCAMTVDLASQLSWSRAVWERDAVARVPVVLPNLLARKYPRYEFAWSWAWVFPSRSPCKHPRSGEIVRWHVLDVNVQRAVREAAHKLELPITPHCFRHSYGTHCLDRGTKITALAKAMGHVNIETTAGYDHSDALSVKSPLDQ